MRRQGVEDVKGKMPVVIDPTPKVCRRKLSKAELREQAEAAFLAWRAGQAAYFIPTTIESGPTKCSTWVLRNPISFIQPAQSAPV